MKEYFHLAWELAIIEDGRRNNSCYIDVRFTSVFLKSHGLNSPQSIRDTKDTIMRPPLWTYSIAGH